MTFDPFAPVPKNPEDENRRVYDDLLPGSNTSPTPAYNPNVQPQAQPVEALPVPNADEALSEWQDVPASTQPHTAPVPNPRENYVRPKADRQRPAELRGKEQVIKERVKSEKPKVRGVILGLSITVGVLVAALIGGGIYVFTNQSQTPSVSSEVALTQQGVRGVPDGFTGQQILDLPRVDEAEKALDAVAADFIQKVGYLGEFIKSDNGTMPLLDGDGEETLLWAAASSIYVIPEVELSDDDIERLLDDANNHLGTLGYTAAVSSPEQFEQPQFFIGAARTGEDGSLQGYSIIINRGIDGTPANVTIAFYSQPHLKSGDEEKFVKFVTDSYNADK